MVNTRSFRSFFTDFPCAWREFVIENARTFDQTLPWFEAFERHLVAAGQEMRIVALANDDDTPMAVLPLKSDRIALLGAVQTRGITALSNYYSALFGPVIRAENESDLSPFLATAALDTNLETPVLDVNPLAEDSLFASHLLSTCRRRGYLVERYFRFGNWYLKVAGRSSKEYFDSLPGQLRSTIQRKTRKLRSDPASRIRIVTEPVDVPAAVEAYEAVYRRSWKVDEPHKEFIRTIVMSFAERGWLRLGLIEVRGTPAAAQLWFVYRGTAAIFKLAYDEEFRDLSVGSVLTATLMQHVIDVDRVSIIDYLCGDDAYKRDWMSDRRERIGLRAVRRHSWQGALVGMSGLVRRIRHRQARK